MKVYTKEDRRRIQTDLDRLESSKGANHKLPVRQQPGKPPQDRELGSKTTRQYQLTHAVSLSKDGKLTRDSRPLGLDPRRLHACPSGAATSQGGRPDLTPPQPTPPLRPRAPSANGQATGAAHPRAPRPSPAHALPAYQGRGRQGPESRAASLPAALGLRNIIGYSGLLRSSADYLMKIEVGEVEMLDTKGNKLHHKMILESVQLTTLLHMGKSFFLSTNQVNPTSQASD
ncbi:uncharacterized protein LOC132681255 [Panthera onca]